MFRLAVVVLAVIGLVSLFSGGVSGAAAGAGFLLVLPLLLLAKVLFIVILFGFFGRAFGRQDPARYDPPWRRRDRQKTSDAAKKTREDAFEEWHRMAHARQEVDSWLEDVD